MPANPTRPTSRRPLEVILHAGQHKTGTTSIQSFLAERSDELAGHGLYVPTTGRFWTGTHYVLISALADEQQEKAAVRQLAAELAEVEQDRVLISGEVAKHWIVEGAGARLIDNLRAAGAGRVHILLYLRSPFALANAAYCQRTGSLVLKGATFEEFLPRLCAERYFDYDQFVRLRERDDVSLTVRPYSSEARRGVTRDLLRTLGVELELKEEQRLNTSYGPIAIEALRRFGAQEPGLRSMALQHFMHLMFRIGRSISERPYWAVDDRVRQMLAEPDRKTDEFSLAVWGRPWRDEIGDEDRPINIFDPGSADAEQRAIFEELQARIREAAATAQAHGAAARSRPKTS
jgi:hypothetical protein